MQPNSGCWKMEVMVKALPGLELECEPVFGAVAADKVHSTASLRLAPRARWGKATPGRRRTPETGAGLGSRRDSWGFATAFAARRPDLHAPAVGPDERHAAQVRGAKPFYTTLDRRTGETSRTSVFLRASNLNGERTSRSIFVAWSSDCPRVGSCAKD